MYTADRRISRLAFHGHVATAINEKGPTEVEPL